MALGPVWGLALVPGLVLVPGPAWGLVLVPGLALEPGPELALEPVRHRQATIAPPAELK